MGSRRRLVIWIVVGILAAFLLLSSTMAYYYTEVLWFEELGISSVFFTVLSARFLLGLAAGLLFGLFIFINLKLVRGTMIHLSGQLAEPGTGRWFAPRIIDRIITLVSVGFGVLTGISMSTEWETLLRFIHQTPFGISDPLHGRDVAFYVFTLPVHRIVFNSAGFLLLLTALVVALIYFFAGSINFLGGRVNVHPRARAHLGGLIAGYLLLKAWGYWLDAFELVYSPRGVAFGAGYTDVHAHLPVFRIMTVLSVLAAGIALWYIKARDIRWFYAAIAVMLVGSVGLGTAYPAAIQRLVVQPNEIQMERPYIEYNIDYTRTAYGLDEVTEVPFAALDTLDWEQLEQNMDTVENVRLWDWQPLLETYRQLHTIRAYYNFPDADVDRYMVNGEYQQVLIAARELDYTQVPGAETWVNRRLQYTHGHGVVMSPAAEFTEEGLPHMYIRDIPPESEIDIQVENPSIYYGEMTQDYVISNTHEPELHYPSGDTNVYMHYDGTGGVALGGLLRRSAFALRFGDYNLVLSAALHPESRIMYHRGLQDRIRRAAPFLMLDDDPYIVVCTDENRLFWIQDAYTHTTRFPYSEPYTRRTNYLRNSVKVVVDAYNGDMDFYIFDEDDAIVQTYEAIFPDLFEPMEEMPETLSSHVRYPMGLFETQMEMFRTYHMTDPVVFYNKEDLWAFPEETFRGQTRRMTPYYIMANLPQVGEELEFLTMMPFTPEHRDVMIAWAAGRSDLENYGELVVYLMPKGRTVLGPSQIEARIDQDDEISQLFTLWGQSGSSVIRGNLLALPIEESLLYVEPIYLEAVDRGLPELRRVVVAHGRRLAMGRSVAEAMEILFGERDPLDPDELMDPDLIDDDDVDVDPPAPDADDAQRAWDLFQRAQRALRDGNWSRYGELMSELEDILERLQETPE